MMRKPLGIFIGLIGILAVWLFVDLVISASAEAQAEEEISKAHIGETLEGWESLPAGTFQVASHNPATGPINSGYITIADINQWTPAGLSTEDIYALAIDPINTNILYVTAKTGDLYRTTDGAKNWSLLNDFAYADPPTIAIDPTNPNILYASSIGKGYKSINGGSSWVELSISSVTAFAVNPSNNAIVYAGTHLGMSGVYKSENGGATWTQVKSESNDVRSIVINPVITNVVYVASDEDTFFGIAGGIFKTIDGGVNWTKVMTHSQVNILALDPFNTNVLYAGTEGNGVFKSVDGGANWTSVNVGLTSSVVRALAVDPAHPNRVYAGTWADGVFRSLNGGASWSSLNTGLTNTDILSLALDPTTTNVLYVGTKGGGVFKGVFEPDPPPGSTYAKVLDENGQPVAGVQVYRNGNPTPGVTNAAGNLILTGVQANDTLVALSPVYTQPTIRQTHAEWAYRVHQTSLTVKNDGNLQPFTVIAPTGPQTLTVKSNNTLILFNLVVSIEWDADEAYIQQISHAVQSASDYFYDLTDGQMAFSQVAIYDSGQYWADADIQISTNNIVRPHAYIGGLTSVDKAHVIRVGRGWDRYGNNERPWDLSDGYRTLAHEFGHYALYLYDEYFAYIFDQNGKLVGETPAICIGPQNRNPATDATNASAMDWQYTSSELSAHDVVGLWSPLCEQTAQSQLNPTSNIYTDPGESAWETLARKYADITNPSRWQLTTPAQRGSIMAGPFNLPDGMLALPIVIINNSGVSGASRQLTVYGPNGEGYWGVIVALYKQNGQVVGQGFTNGNGQLAIYGAEPGDTIRAASFDGGLSGNIIVGSEMSLNLTLTPVREPTIQTMGNIPHMRVIAEPGANPARIDLLVSLMNFGSAADPSVIVTNPGSEVGSAPTLSYSAFTGVWDGQINFSATEHGTGHIRAVAETSNSLAHLQSTYRLHRILNTEGYDIYSDDGNLSLHLNPNSLPGNEAYFVVMPPGAIPGPLPAGLTLVGNPYDVTVSGALLELEKPAVLTLHYDTALVNPTLTPTGLAIYRWNPASQTWQTVPGNLDEAHKAIVAPVTLLGIYALLVPPGPWTEPPPKAIFLPVIIKSD